MRFMVTVNFLVDADPPDGLDGEQERQWVQAIVASGLSSASIDEKIAQQIEAAAFRAQKPQSASVSHGIESTVEDAAHPRDFEA